MRANDEARVAPGGDDLIKLFGDKPNLILLDETLEYLINAGGVKVEKTDLREQTLKFLKELTVAAANAPRTVVLLALASSQPSETLNHSQLLQTLDHFVGRKDTLREPVEQDEVFKVIQRRLLEKMPEDFPMWVLREMSYLGIRIPSGGQNMALRRMRERPSRWEDGRDAKKRPARRQVRRFTICNAARLDFVAGFGSGLVAFLAFYFAANSCLTLRTTASVSMP